VIKPYLDFRDFSRDIDIRISETGPIDSVFLAKGILAVCVYVDNLSHFQIFNLNNIDFSKDIDPLKEDLQTNSVKYSVKLKPKAICLFG
jgi:hypothetical protein